jgi:hypothetical protein
MSELTPDIINAYISNNKTRRTIIQSVKKGITNLASGLQFINKIKNDLPNKNDNKFTSTIKIVGIISNLLSSIPTTTDIGAMSRISKAFNLKETYNPGLMDLVRDFNLMSLFQKIYVSEDNEKGNFSDKFGKVSLYYHPKIGTIGTRDSVSEVSSMFLHSSDFNPKSIWDLVWSKSEGCIDVQQTDQSYKTFMFNTYNLDIGNQFGSSQRRIQKFIESNRKFIDMGYERSYLFVGPPGAGKSTMSQKFAHAFSNKIIQFTPMVILKISDISVSNLINEAEAEVILIDEMDKLFSELSQYNQGLMLARIEKLRRCRPGLITIFTANNINKFPTAMLRPGRIDDIIEFKYPGLDDRKAILVGYAKSIGVDILPEVVDEIAKQSNGLTGAWLKEVVMQMKVSDADSACSLITKMLKYSRPKKKKTEEDDCEEDSSYYEDEKEEKCKEEECNVPQASIKTTDHKEPICWTGYYSS